jgi:hypothetical protein
MVKRGIPDTLKIEVEGLAKPITGLQFKAALAQLAVAKSAKIASTLVVFKVSVSDKAVAEADSLLAAMVPPAGN